MLESTADIATEKASRYLQQLCKHFAHKIPVSFDAAAGQISFSGGDCRLEADDNRLRLSVTASDAETLAKLQNVAASHLVRFAFREEMQITWQRV
ncbi:DUF2218 domain-containing protein [Hwanghaeella grinnelliae]|uniref:DUF2218 domain-containing protein n=2 Tax=Hwanghaeella grinnelliae TaxID=2500179 RepID=A0A437QR40_9PROT|nr:DUF2218 domain-containing protein [Hwanghaeella grinnelliae]